MIISSKIIGEADILMTRKRRMIKFAGFYSFFYLVAFSLAFASGISYDSGSRRDPMIPLVGPDGIIAKKEVSRKTDMEGIVYDPDGDSVVVIGGELYRTGDTLGDAKIIKIFKDRILILQEDEEKTIWLREEIVQ